MVVLSGCHCLWWQWLLSGHCPLGGNLGMATGWVRMGFFVPGPDPWAKTRGPNPTHLLNGFFSRSSNLPQPGPVKPY